MLGCAVAGSTKKAVKLEWTVFITVLRIKRAVAKVLLVQRCRVYGTK